MTGGAGNDSEQGLAGDDWLTPGAGVESVDGGDGVAWSASVDATALAVIDLAADTAVIGAEMDMFLNIENVTGTNFADLISCYAGANRLQGLAGNDTLRGADGADTLDGGRGMPFCLAAPLWPICAM